jgi:hypothetical protein
VYTLTRLYPTLAIVEAADSPPRYELVAGKEVDNDEDGKANGSSNSKDTAIEADTAIDGKVSGSSAPLMPDETAGVPSTPSQPVTNGVIATLRLLRASGGGLFKAYRWRFLTSAVIVSVFAILSSVPYLPSIAASIIASLAATKVETAWTHAAVSTQRDGRLWNKLPSFLVIFKATAIPLVAEAILVEIVNAVAFLPLSPRTGSWDPLGVIPRRADGQSFTRLPVVLLLLFTLYTFLLVPSEVVLTRTRASSMRNSFLVQNIPRAVLCSSLVKTNSNTQTSTYFHPSKANQIFLSSAPRRRQHTSPA